MRRLQTDNSQPLTPEEAEQSYRAIRRSLIIAVPLAWLVVVLAIARHPGSVLVTVLLVVAVLYPVICWIMLGYVRRDVYRRVAPPDGRPDIGL